MRSLLLLLIATISGCAESPPTQSPPAAAAPVATAAAPKAAPVIAPAATFPASAGADQPGVTKELISQGRQNGYELRRRHNAQVFCKSEPDLGSRLPKEKCVTPEGLLQSIRETQDAQEAMRKGSLCSSQGCASH